MRVGYAKLGRAWEPDLDKLSTVGGDVDVLRCLQRMRAACPKDTFVLIGKTSSDPRAVLGRKGLEFPWYEDEKLMATKRGEKHVSPSQVSDCDDTVVQRRELKRYVDSLDVMVVWVGQHGSSAYPTPRLEDGVLTAPLLQDLKYSRYICDLVNGLSERFPDREAIWLVPDVRNYIKVTSVREVGKRPVLAQFDDVYNWRHHAPLPGNDRNFVYAKHEYEYSAIEMCAIPNPSEWPRLDAVPFGERAEFGLLCNENRRTAPERRRANILRKLFDEGEIDDVEMYGTWSEEGMKDMGRTRPIAHCAHSRIMQAAQRWCCTLTMPASGSGWATSKPWEMFAAGTACLFHPEYDTQGHVVKLAPDAPYSGEDLLSKVLRFKTKDDFDNVITRLSADEDAWSAVVDAQREHLLDRFEMTGGGVLRILQRLDEVDGGHRAHNVSLAIVAQDRSHDAKPRQVSLF